MATISFDSKFELQKEYVDSFFDALDKMPKMPRIPDSPYVGKKERERGGNAIKKILESIVPTYQAD